jgi:hypothetical protein
MSRPYKLCRGKLVVVLVYIVSAAVYTLKLMLAQKLFPNMNLSSKKVIVFHYYTHILYEQHFVTFFSITTTIIICRNKTRTHNVSNVLNSPYVSL